MVDGVLGCGAGQEVENQAIKTVVSWLRFGVPLPSALPLARKIVQFLQQNIALDSSESVLFKFLLDCPSVTLLDLPLVNFAAFLY